MLEKRFIVFIVTQWKVAESFLSKMPLSFLHVIYASTARRLSAYLSVQTGNGERAGLARSNCVKIHRL